MRTAAIYSVILAISACAATSSSVHAEDSEPITLEELAYSFDSGKKDGLSLYTDADRDCTLEKAFATAETIGQPEAGKTQIRPTILVEGLSGLNELSPQISNRELLTLRLIGEAAVDCQIEDN